MNDHPDLDDNGYECLAVMCSGQREEVAQALRRIAKLVEDGADFGVSPKNDPCLYKFFTGHP